MVKIVFTYILFGFAKCQEIQTDSKASKDLMKYLTKVEAFKKAFDETTAASLLKELKMPPTKIPPKFHKSPLVRKLYITIKHVFTRNVYRYGLQQ